MTSPEVDQELERLFAVARVAAAPDAEARARVRARLSQRLAGSGAENPSAGRSRAWLAGGVAVLGTLAITLWMAGKPRATGTNAAVARAVPGVSAPAPVVSPTTLPEPAPTAVTAPAPVLEVPRATPALRADKPTPSSIQSSPSATEELPLVRAMQQALRAGNPGQALVLADDHARRFPRGTLLEEREGVRAVARCQIAAPEARSLVLSSFLQRFATSPYAARVKAACQ